VRNLPQPKSNFRSLPPSIAGAAGLEQILRGQFAKLDGESLNSATTSKPLVSIMNSSELGKVLERKNSRGLLCGGRVNAGEVLRGSDSHARHGLTYISAQMGLPSDGG
jgi:hypothetical protein